MNIIDAYQLNAIVIPILVGLLVATIAYEIGCDVMGR